MSESDMRFTDNLVRSKYVAPFYFNKLTQATYTAFVIPLGFSHDQPHKDRRINPVAQCPGQVHSPYRL